VRFESVGEMPPDEIVAATGADRDDDLHGAVGIRGLRLRHRRAEHERRERDGNCCRRSAKPKHRIPPATPAAAAFSRPDYATCRAWRQRARRAGLPDIAQPVWKSVEE
jgi:hypothetical protein